MSFESNLLNEYEYPLNFSFNNQTTNSYDIPPIEECCSLKQGLLTLLYSFTSLLSFFGNIISIVVLSVGNRSSRELKKFLINLSVADILMALFSIPFTYTDFMLGRWIFPSVVCPFAQFITIFALSGSVGTLTVIAVERYIAVMHPLHSILLLGRKGTLILAIVWFMATVLSSPQLFYTKTVSFTHGNNSYLKCKEVASRLYSTTYSMVIFVITFILPFITLVYVYGCIGFKMFRRHKSRLTTVENNCHIKAKLRTVKMCAVLVLLFIVCWLPIQLFNLIIWVNPLLLVQLFGLNKDSYMALFFFCHWIAMAHSFVNPIIYCFMSANFRDDLSFIFSRIFPGLYKGERNNSINNSTLRKISLSSALSTSILRKTYNNTAV